MGGLDLMSACTSYGVAGHLFTCSTRGAFRD